MCHHFLCPSLFGIGENDQSNRHIKCSLTLQVFLRMIVNTRAYERGNISPERLQATQNTGEYQARKFLRQTAACMIIIAK